MCLSKGQEAAFNAMMSGENVFLTGEAGTGKSYVIKEFLKHTSKKVRVCAPTGIAAINVGGVTLHRAFKLPLKDLRPDTFIKTNGAISSAEVIIIDEISMCRMDVFTAVASVLRHARKPKQLIVVGDFFQLPPVLTWREKEFFIETWNVVLGEGYTKNSLTEPYPFLSDTWNEFHFRTIYLTEQMRQKDDRLFLDALNRVRTGDGTVLQWVMSNAAKEPAKGAIYLCGRNDKAAEINEQKLEELRSTPMTYTAVVTGEINKSDFPVEERIVLKVGCRVMAVINDTMNGKYVNGSLGTVKRLEDDYIVVDFDNGNKGVSIDMNDWEIMDYKSSIEKIAQFRKVLSYKDGKPRLSAWKDAQADDILPEKSSLDDGTLLMRVVSRKEFKLVPCGSVVQLPVKLAYAVTIHKSQGQTYDSVILDPCCFASGQLYVALSRVRRIEDIYLESPIELYYLKTSWAVRDFYRKIADKDNELQELSAYPVSSEKVSKPKPRWKRRASKRTECVI